MRRGIAVLAVATATIGTTLTAVGQSANGAPRTRVAATTSYTPPPISWHSCPAGSTLAAFGAQCGELVVPMNYAEPQGTKIGLAISRRLHKTTDPADYQGVMVVSSGVAGSSSLDYAVLPDLFGIPHNAGDGYDWIGFDPRGVGSSRPSLSCDPGLFGGDRPPYRPANDKIMHKWVSRSKQYASDCAQAKHAALFNHVSTRDSADDLESMRKALEQHKLNFYGFTYGTYLAAVYMTLHPSRVRRVVLDSTVVDPRSVFYQNSLDQDAALQKALDVFFTWLAKHSDVYDVGASHDAVRKQFLATEAKLDKHAASGFLGGDELLDVFTSAASDVYGWADIADAYSQYVNHNKAGSLIEMYKDAHDTSPGGDNGYAMRLATQCTDAHWPRNQANLNSENRHLDGKYDYFTWANAWFNGPCAYWPVKAGQPVQVTGQHVDVPILMIDETYDAVTPFAGSLYVRKIFPTASLIEGRNGTTNAGSLSGVACTDNAIASYLTDGSVPQRQDGNRSDKVCPPVPAPNPN